MIYDLTIYDLTIYLRFYDLLRNDNLLDLHFVAAEEPCVFAATMGTDLAVRDGRVVFSAAVAMGDSGNGFDLQFAAP